VPADHANPGPAARAGTAAAPAAPRRALPQHGTAPRASRWRTGARTALSPGAGAGLRTDTCACAQAPRRSAAADGWPMHRGAIGAGRRGAPQAQCKGGRRPVRGVHRAPSCCMLTGARPLAQRPGRGSRAEPARAHRAYRARLKARKAEEKARLVHITKVRAATKAAARGAAHGGGRAGGRAAPPPPDTAPRASTSAASLSAKETGTRAPSGDAGSDGGGGIGSDGGGSDGSDGSMDGTSGGGSGCASDSDGGGGARASQSQDSAGGTAQGIWDCEGYARSTVDAVWAEAPEQLAAFGPEAALKLFQQFVTAFWNAKVRPDETTARTSLRGHNTRRRCATARPRAQIRAAARGQRPRGGSGR